MPKSKSYTPTKGRCTCLQQYSILPQWDPKEVHDNSVRTPLRSFQIILRKCIAANKHAERWTKSSLTEIITVWGRLYLSTYLNKLHGTKMLDMIPKTGMREFRNPIPSRSHQPQRRSECLYDLTSAFKELETTRRRFCPQSRKSKRKLYKGIVPYQWTTGTSTKRIPSFFFFFSLRRHFRMGFCSAIYPGLYYKFGLE